MATEAEPPPIPADAKLPGWRAPTRTPVKVWSFLTFITPIVLLLGIFIPQLHFLLFVVAAMGTLEGVRLLPRHDPSVAESMLELPASGAQFPVQIVLSHEYEMYGQDTGVLTVMDGGVYFSGEQTDFSVTLENARLRTSDSHPLTVDKPPAKYDIDFRSRTFEGSVTITPIARGGRAKEVNRELCFALLRWREAPVSAAWRKTLDPPTTPQPGMRPHRSGEVNAQRLLCLFETYMAIFFASSFFLQHGTSFLAVAGAGTAFLFSLVFVFWLGVRIWHPGLTVQEAIELRSK